MKNIVLMTLYHGVKCSLMVCTGEQNAISGSYVCNACSVNLFVIFE